MNYRYTRLIALAEENDDAFNQSKLLEINELLASLSANEIQPEHFQMLDGLISTMFLTGNVLGKYEDKIEGLLDGIRSLRVN